MQLGVQFDLSAVIDDLDGVARAGDEGLEVSLEELGETTMQTKQVKVERTYQRPIGKTKAGNDKWTRDGKFRSNQTLEKSLGRRVIATRGEAEEYEGVLSDLPTGDDGINRTNDATQDTLRDVVPHFEEVVRRNVGNSLGRLK